MDSLIKKHTIPFEANETSSLKMEKIIKKNHFTLDQRPVKLGEMTDYEECGEPVINFKKKGDVLHTIEVICTCGRKIEIFCEYD